MFFVISTYGCIIAVSQQALIPYMIKIILTYIPIKCGIAQSIPTNRYLDLTVHALNSEHAHRTS